MSSLLLAICSLLLAMSSLLLAMCRVRLAMCDLLLAMRCLLLAMCRLLLAMSILLLAMIRLLLETKKNRVKIHFEQRSGIVYVSVKCICQSYFKRINFLRGLIINKRAHEVVKKSYLIFSMVSVLKVYSYKLHCIILNTNF